MSRLIGKFPEKCQFSKKDSLDGCIFPCLLVSSGFPDGPSQVFSCKFKASGGRLTIASVGVLWEADSKRDKVVMHLQGATPVRENGRKPGKAGRALRLQFMSDPSEGEREREKKGVEASWSTYSLRWAEWGLWAASSQVSCQPMTFMGGLSLPGSSHGRLASMQTWGWSSEVRSGPLENYVPLSWMSQGVF